MECDLLAEVDEGRIEIELTPVADRGDARHQHAAPPMHPPAEGRPSDDVSSPADAPERRLVIVALIVGIVALVAGWLLGRTSAPSTAVAPPTTVEAPDSPTVVPTSAPGPTMPPVVDTQAPVRPAPTIATSTTMPAEPEVTTVEVDSRLAGIDLRIVGYSMNGELQELDLATGTFIEYPTQGSMRDGWLLFAGPDWIVVPSTNGSGSYLVDADGQITRRSNNYEVYLGDAARGSFWVFDYSGASGTGQRLIEIGVDAEPTGAAIVLPGNTWADAVDPAGGVIAQVGGRWFSVTPDGAAELGDGELISLSTDLAVMYQCAGALECGMVWIDRLTGEVRPIGGLDGMDDSVVPIRWWGPADNSGVAPDGSHVAITVQTASSIELVVADLEAGTANLATDDFQPPFAIWSDDSRFVFTLSNSGLLRAHDLTNGDDIAVTGTSMTVRWRTITRRSAAPG